MTDTKEAAARAIAWLEGFTKYDAHDMINCLAEDQSGAEMIKAGLAALRAQLTEARRLLDQASTSAMPTRLDLEIRAFLATNPAVTPDTKEG